MVLNTSGAYQTPTSRRLIGGVLSALFCAFTGAYGLSVCGFLILRTMMPDSPSVLLFGVFLHLLLIPALILLPLCLVLRRWLLCVILLPIFVVTVNWYAPQFLPNKTPNVTGTRLTLMSFNLYDEAEDPLAFIALIRKTDADLVALQELSDDAAQKITTTLGDDYPYMALNPVAGDPVAGQGFLSRYPIIDVDFWQTSRGHQRLQIEVDGKSLVIYNTHLINPLTAAQWDQHAADINMLLNHITGEALPLLIAGDFNMTPWLPAYAQLSQRVDDAFRTAGQGFGFTFNPLRIRRLALARIDYVFYQGVDVVDVDVLLDTAESDHHPLIVKVVLPTIDD